MQRPCRRRRLSHQLPSPPCTPPTRATHTTHVMTHGNVCLCLWRAQHGNMEPTDFERESNLVHEDSVQESCLAGIFERLYRLRRQQQPSVELSARERRLVQEAALTAAHTVAREAAEAAARALAPQVAQELARVVLRDVARTKHA